MRIVHVTDCYLPQVGGIETQVADLVRHQLAAGHDVHVVTNTADDAGPTAQVHRVRTGWMREMLVGSPRTSQAVIALRPDVVHCHNSVLSPLAIAVAAAALDRGIATALTVHSLLPTAGPFLPMSGWLLGVRNPRLAWSAVSEVAAVLVRRVLGGRARVDVLPNAVDVGWWREAAHSQPEQTRHEVRVVTVGRLAMRKRPLALIDMMARVRTLVHDEVPLRLIIVGDGPQRSRVAHRVHNLDMSSWVDLPGQLPRGEIRDVLAAADLYVAPAVLESFGIAALEARCAGLPVVAKGCGGVSEFVTDGTEGVLSTTDEDMARSLARLIESPRWRNGIRAHNSAVVPAFGWDDALTRTDQLYARAANLAGQPASPASPASLVATAELQEAR
jgi:glycosyltransferase involved in cell wall biosynthesis